MEARKRRRLLVDTALVGGALLLGGVVLADPAHADQTSYLKDVHNDGIHDVDGGDAALLTVGQKLCSEVWYGESPSQLAGMALQNSDSTLGSKGLTPQKASDLVNYAVADLCPNY